MSRIISDKRLKEIIGFVAAFGKDQTLEHFAISESTLERYLRKAKADLDLEPSDRNAVLSKIGDVYSDDELKAIANGARILPGQARVPVVSFQGERVRIGALSDTHYGSIHTDPNHTFQAFEEFAKEDVDFIVHCGDVTEGMSHRQGHVYELSHIGYTSQKEEACRILGQAPAPMYLIDGNHDRWYVKSNGAYIVQSIADKLGYTYLGQDEGDISLKGRATLKLWHGEDGSSYALSYRLQKIIESLSGGEKPNVLMAGHVHKCVYIFERNIHTYGVGTMQRQTKWMRGKRIAAHVGFWIIDIWVGKTGVAKSTGTWYPFYA